MANLSATQKKKRNSFVALLIGILVVLAAIVYVVYAGVMSKSAFLENQDFATALSEVFGKSARSVSEEDLAGVKYLELYHDTESDICGLAIGDEEFIAKYNEAMASEDAENADTSYYDLAKSATFEADDDMVFADLKYFTGVEALNLNMVTIEDASVIGQFKNLKRGSFASCGITDVSAFASLNLDAIEELNFSGNTISDWTALEAIADKVIVNSSYSVEMDEDGNYTLVPVEITLADQLAEEEAENAEGEEAEAENSEEGDAEAEGENDEAEASEEAAADESTTEAE